MEKKRSRHISRLGNLQFAIQDRTREAIEEINDYLNFAGGIYDIEKYEKYHVLFENKGTESGIGFISNIGIDIDGKLRIGMTNGLNLYEEELSPKHIIDIIIIIQEGHGTYSK